MAKRFLVIGVAGLLAALAACNASDSPGDCTTLPTCCVQLANSADKSECMRVVAMGDDVSCGDAQSTFEVDNLCTVTSSVGAGAPESGCAGLATCCSSLSATEKASCLDAEASAAGDDSACDATVSSLYASQCPNGS